VPERIDATDHLADCGDRPSRADGNPADWDASPDKRDYFTQNIGDDTQRSR
jgi:hypothetical protein